MKEINLNVVQYNKWKKVREEILFDMKKRKHINKPNAALIVELHATLFNHKPVRPCCPNKWVDSINALDALYDKYNVKHNVKEDVELTTDSIEKLRVGDDEFVIGKPHNGEGKLFDINVDEEKEVMPPFIPDVAPRPNLKSNFDKRIDEAAKKRNATTTKKEASGQKPKK